MEKQLACFAGLRDTSLSMWIRQNRLKIMSNFNVRTQSTHRGTYDLILVYKRLSKYHAESRDYRLVNNIYNREQGSDSPESNPKFSIFLYH